MLASLIRFICVLMFLIVTPALAQNEGTDEPVTGFSSDPSAASRLIESLQDTSAANPATDASKPLSETEAVPVLVIGDALAGGMGAGMSRLAGGKYQIANRFNESSGMARPEFYDWAEAVPKIIEGKGFKAAVVLVGANDRQDIRVGQFRYAFNTPEWKEAYTLQIDRLVDVLKADGLQVYWVSVPPMGDALYNRDMMVLNDIIQERVVAKGESFVDIRPAFLGPDGQYTDRGPDESGVERRLRARDGVEFFKAGNNRLGQLVLAALDARRAAPDQDGAVASGTEVAPAAKTYPDDPVMGHSLGRGESETFDTVAIADAIDVDAKKAEAAKVAAVQNPVVPIVPQVKIIDAVAAPGTDAEKLLTTGLAPTAPSGRFDDFSYVVPPPVN